MGVDTPLYLKELRTGIFSTEPLEENLDLVQNDETPNSISLPRLNDIINSTIMRLPEVIFHLNRILTIF